MIARLLAFYAPAREPLRRSVYTALLALVAVAVAAGIVTGAVALSLGGALAAILAIVPATEVARSKVTPALAETEPVTPIYDEPGDHAAPES